MISQRIVWNGILILGSWMLGRNGAYLIWNFIYSIGARVIEDETYYAYHDLIVRVGGVAGVMTALAGIFFFYNSALKLLIVTHALAMAVGFVGGAIGWREGIYSYFAGLFCFTVVSCLIGKKWSGGKSNMKGAA